MKKTSFLRVFALLGIISLVVWGCGGWLARKQAQNSKDQLSRQEAEKMQTANDAANMQLIRDTLQLEDIILSIERDKPYHAICGYRIDTSKTRRLPHFNSTNFFDYYAFLLGFGEEDSLVIIRSESINHIGSGTYKFTCYHQGFSTGIEVGLSFQNHVIYSIAHRPFTWLKDADTTTTISKQQAAEIALQLANEEARKIHPVFTAKLLLVYSKSTPKGGQMSIALTPNGIVYGFIAEILTEYYPISINAKTGETNIAKPPRRYDDLCSECDFSTATSTSQLLDMYNNGMIAYGPQAMELQTCAIAGCEVYRLEQNNYPFKVQGLFQSPGGIVHEDTKWTMPEYCSEIDPPISINVGLGASVATISYNGTSSTATSLVANAINKYESFAFSSDCQKPIAIAVGNAPLPANVNWIADGIARDILIELPINDIAQYEIQLAGGTDFQEYFSVWKGFNIGPELSTSTQKRYSLKKLFQPEWSQFPLKLSWGNYAVLLRYQNPNNGIYKYYNINNIYLKNEIHSRGNLVLFGIDKTFDFFRGTNNTPYGSTTDIIRLNTDNSAINAVGDINGFNSFLNSSDKKPIYLTEGQLYSGGINMDDNSPYFNSIYYDIIANTLSVDAVAHEFVHGIDNWHHALGYIDDDGLAPIVLKRITNSEYGESASIEEALCDVFGVLVESTVKPIDWAMGNDVFPVGTTGIRNFAAPHANMHPAVYLGTYWTGHDYHSNSTVISHFFYLLAQGGTATNEFACPYAIEGQGISTASRIAYLLLTTDDDNIMLSTSTDLEEFARRAVKAALEVAQQDAGASADYCHAYPLAAANALKAVGLDFALAGYVCNSYTFCCPAAVCDYSLPRLDKINIYDDINDYSNQYWHWERNAANEPVFCLKNRGQQGISANTTVTIEVRANEKLQDITFEGFRIGVTIYGSGSGVWELVEPAQSRDGITWICKINVINIPLSGANKYKALFSGHDLSGNQLEKVQEYMGFGEIPPCIPAANIPHFNGTGWTPAAHPGTSGVFDIILGDCSDAQEDDICDNHLPHLQELTVYYPGFDPNIYEQRIDRQTWAENGNQLCFEQEIPGYYVDFSTDDDINLLVKASEPLSALQLQRISLGGIVYEISASSSPLSLNSVIPNAEQTEWIFTLHYDDTPIYSNVYLTTDGAGDNLNAYRLHFVGHDLAGNPLQVIESMNTYDAAVLCLGDIGELPHRIATGEWSARYDGTDQAFRFNIDFCEELWFSAPNFPAFLNIIPDGDAEPAPVSYSILDNATGTFVIENVPIIDPADDTYNANGDICATLGSLPDSYTVFVTYLGGCQKVLSGNIAVSPCTFSGQVIGFSTQVAEGDYTIVSSRLWLSLDAEYPCTVNISGGSIDSNSGNGGNPATLSSAGGSTHEIMYRVLTVELNYDFPYYVTDANGCIFKGSLRPYHISPVVYNPSFDPSKPNSSDICARATACFDYTFESQEPAVPMYCSSPDAVVSVISDELQGDGQTYRQTGRVCYTDQGEQVGTTQVFALIAQPLSGLGDTVAYSVSIIPDLQVATSVQHARSVCGDDNCAGTLSVSASAGSGHYEYEWDNGATTATLSDLCGGTYVVTVSDIETGCATTTTGQVGIIVTSGNTEVVTYTAAAELIKPDIRLAPALFDSQTKVEYTLPEDGFVTIKVYNLQGILVETLVSNEYRTAGNYQLNDEGGEYANGLYLFSLEVCNRNKAVIGIKW